MNIINNNNIGLKFTKNFMETQKNSLIYKNLEHIRKNSNMSCSNDKEDTLTLSKEALFKSKLRNLDKTTETTEAGLGASVEHAMFLNMVGGLVNGIINNSQTQIEDSMKSYSSYIGKIEDGTLDEKVSFDDYADSESKKKYQSSLLEIMDTSGSETNPSTKTEEVKPSKSIENIDTIKNQAREQLQNRIEKIKDDSVNNLNNVFDGIQVSSKELEGQINEIKRMVTSLTASLKEINLSSTESNSNFVESLKKVLENMSETQNKISKYTYTELKNTFGSDKDYLSIITEKYESESENNLKRYQYECNLVDKALS